MKQISLAAAAGGFELKTKRTRKCEFLDEMELVVPWGELEALIEPHAPQGKTGRPPFPMPTWTHDNRESVPGTALDGFFLLQTGFVKLDNSPMTLNTNQPPCVGTHVIFDCPRGAYSCCSWHYKKRVTTCTVHGLMRNPICKRSTFKMYTSSRHNPTVHRTLHDKAAQLRRPPR